MASVFEMAFNGDEAGLRKMLTAKDSKINTLSADRHATLLYTAARGGHLSMVKMLLEEFNADITLRNGENGGLSNVLHGAAYGGHHGVLAYLLVQPGALELRDQKNAYGETPRDNAKEPAGGVKKGDAKKCIALIDNPPTPPKKEEKEEEAEADATPPPPAAAPAPAPVVAAPPPAASPEKDDSFSVAGLLSKGIQELRAMCKKFGLSTTGTKEKLIERIKSKSQAEGSPAKKSPPKGPAAEGDNAEVGTKAQGKHAEKEEEQQNDEDEEPPKKKQKQDDAIKPAAGSTSPKKVAAAVEEVVGTGPLAPDFIEKLRAATFTKTEMEKDTEEWWELEDKMNAQCQGRNDDYVKKRLKKKQKPITFILKRAWEVKNETLTKAFQEKEAELIAANGKKDTRVRRAFHGTKEQHIDSILKTSLLRFKHPLNPCKEQADDGYFGTNKKGVYVSRYYDYTLKYCNGLNPLEPEEKVKIILFDCLPGKVFNVPALNMGMDPHTEGGFNAHSSPNNLEWYLFDERQLNPTHILEIQAKEDHRTAADDE